MIRFAIFAAVSTRPQAAADKISLPEQIKLCRNAGKSHQWKETAGPFIIPGETRTQWINLRDAEEQITNPDGTHPLRDLLDAAKRREYDVLILYHYNRLRIHHRLPLHPARHPQLHHPRPPPYEITRCGHRRPPQCGQIYLF